MYIFILIDKMWRELKNRVRLLREIPIEYVMIALNSFKILLLAAVLWVIKNDRKVKIKTNMIYFCALIQLLVDGNFFAKDQKF